MRVQRRGCAGASAVARAQQRATARQALVRGAIAAPIVRRVFAITGVDRLVAIFDSVPAAVAAPAGARAGRRGAGDPGAARR